MAVAAGVAVVQQVVKQQGPCHEQLFIMQEKANFEGQLKQHYLMLQATTLPAVIEGCNSREACESSGKPFIHSSGYPGLRQYKVELKDQQELHKEASACLEAGDPKFLPQLVQYMESSLNADSDLRRYHQQRQMAFMARPDACENALNILGIKYKIEDPKVAPGSQAAKPKWT